MELTMTDFNYTRDHAPRFTKAMNFLVATKNTQVDDLKFEAYFRQLSDLPIEAVEKAANKMALTPGPFLPDAGTWYRSADLIASESLEKDLNATVKQLPSGRHIGDDEIQRTIVARGKFVALMEKHLGRKLPDTHPMKSSIPKLPTYSCVTCEDLGWVYEKGKERRMKHCYCWDYNPTLQRRRANSATKEAKKYF
jgi:hypothetical protein